MHFDVSDETTSVWRLLSPGTHGRIATALDGDTDVQNAIKAKLQNPDDGPTRQTLIALITRRTGNCVGEAASNQALNPASDTTSAYKLLQPGTEGQIADAIGASSDTHDALATGDRFVIVRKISRMTGNCIGQAAVAQGINVLGNLF